LSTQLDLSGDPELAGQTLYGRYYIPDPAAAEGLAISRRFRITVFGGPNEVLLDGFE
jgi:hypothetical protein